MAHIAEYTELGLASPLLVEGLPGVGLVGKIATSRLVEGIEPLLGTDIDTETLVDQAEEVADARERLAQRMRENDAERSQATPLGM